MERVFDTKNSLNKFRRFILINTVIFLAIGFYPWYRKGNLSYMLELGIVGFVMGVIIYLIQWLAYGNVTYAISHEGLIKRRGARIVRSVKLEDSQYYFFSKEEIYPKVRVKNGKDFVFPMTLGVTGNIVNALENVGIRKKV
jgi:hypothetical protein